MEHATGGDRAGYSWGYLQGLIGMTTDIVTTDPYTYTISRSDARCTEIDHIRLD